MIPAYSYAGYGAARRARPTLTDDSRIRPDMDEIMREIMLRLAYSGSGGIISLDARCDSFSLRIGSSPCVEALRPMERDSETAAADDSGDFRDALTLSVIEQMQELQAALSLNKSQLARVLRVSRPALYEWFRGKEPNPANSDRLHTLMRCLAQARAPGASPLNARFVRQPADLHGRALLDLLSDERIDSDGVVQAIQEAQALGDAATRGRVAREKRLRELGFDDPGDEQRKEHLARNMALRDWPNR